LRSFGAFVDLGGADGLIHISELAWHRVSHPREVVKVGDEIEVYVLGLDKEDQRIALSRKRLLPNPWSLAEDKYEIDQLVEGNVTRIVSYGAFVEIEPGIEGLLHISQLSRENVQDAHEVITEGEDHLLRIISLDSERQRIGLSLKGVTESEQIEWMNQRDLERAEREAEEAEVGDDEAAIAVADAVVDADESEIATDVADVDEATEEAESTATEEYDETAEVLAEVESALNMDEEE
jgi:ribosomal protein S1